MARTFRYSELRFKHPGDLDGEPGQVAQRAAKDVSEAAAVFARHVEATVRQVRSGWISDEMRRHPELSPRELAEGWEASGESRACVRLIRAARAANSAVTRLQSG